MAIETALSVLEGNHIILLLALVVLFVIAYRILQAVIHTAMVAVLSGFLLIGLEFLGLGPDVTVTNFIFFMVLGTALFLFYSGVAIVISASESVFDFFSIIYSGLSGLFDRDGGTERKEKEIILEELKDD